MIGRKAILILAGNLIGAVAGVILLALVGRFMGPAPYGALAVALGIIGLAQVPFHGFHQAHVKRINEGLDLAECNGTLLAIKSVAVAVTAALVVAAGWFWHQNFGFTDATTFGAILAATLLFVVDEMRNVVVSTLEALRRIAATQFLFLVENLARVPLVFLAAFYFGFATGRDVPFKFYFEELLGFVSGGRAYDAGDGAVLLAVAFASATGLSLAVGVYLWKRQGIPLARPSRAMVRAYWSFAAVMSLSSAIAVIATRLDTLMIGYFWSSTEVGYYYAAQRIASLLVIIPTAFGTIFFPLIAGLVMTGDPAVVRAAAITTQRAMSILIVLGAVLFSVFAQEGIAFVMTPSFLPAAPILIALAINTLLQTLGTVQVHILMAHGLPRRILLISSIGVVLIFLFNVLLIPTSILGFPLAGLGGLGAAVGTVLGQLVLLGMLLVSTRRLLGVWIWSRSILLHLTAGGMVAGALWYFKTLHLVDLIGYAAGLAVQGTLGALAYFGLLMLMGELGKKDLLLVRNLLDPRNIVADISEEMGLQR